MENNNVILIIFILSITFNAIGDALKFKSYSSKEPKTSWYHLFWVLTLGSLLSILFLHLTLTIAQVLLYMLAYALIRFGLFDFVFNIVSAHNLMYIGTTAGVDKFLRKIFNTPNKLSALPAIRMLIILVGVGLIQYVI